MPKPLFPVAGVPMLQHHIEACAKVSFILKYWIVSSFEMLALVCFFFFVRVSNSSNTKATVVSLVVGVGNF